MNSQFFYFFEKNHQKNFFFWYNIQISRISILVKSNIFLLDIKKLTNVAKLFFLRIRTNDVLEFSLDNIIFFTKFSIGML